MHMHLVASASACLRLRPAESSCASKLSDGAFVAAAVGIAFAAVAAVVASLAGAEAAAAAAAADDDDDDDDDDGDDNDDDDDDDDDVPNPVAAAAAAAVVVETAVVEGRVLRPRGIVSVEVAIGTHDFKHLPMASIVPWHRA